MEGRAERSSEGEPLSGSQDVIIREISGSDIPTASPGEISKPAEKKLLQAQSRSSIVPAPHHRSSQSSDRHGHSASHSGALDLQALVGRSGSSSLSSVSGITVPIRLDALSYLLNNAVLGAYKTPPQMPCYPPMYPTCPYTQMGYSYSNCMSSPSFSMPCMNPLPTWQPGVTQPGLQPFQNPMPNFNQPMGGVTQNQNPNVFSSGTPFNTGVMTTTPFNTGVMTTTPFNTGVMTTTPFNTGAVTTTPFNTGVVTTTPTVQDGRGNLQPDSNTWPRKTNNGFGNNKGNPFSSDSEKQSSPPPQRGFVRFGDKQSEDNWSGRPQNSFNRGTGRGRGDFGGRSWQGNSNGQERRFGDRSWNMDSGGRRRFQDSPDRGQDRGSSFKRGRWQDSRGRDGENRDGWQQRKRQGFSPPWGKAETSQDRFKSNEEEKVISKTDESSAKDEDWEMEYEEEPAASETPDQSSSSSLPPTSKTCDSPQTLRASDKSIDNNEDVKELLTNRVPEKVEEDSDSSSNKGDPETMEIKPQDKGEDPDLGPVDDSGEKTVEVGEEATVEAVYTYVITVDGDENKGILLEVDAEGQ